MDLLAAPISAELSTSVKVDTVRIRPRSGKGLHAHVTPEALTVEESMILIDIGWGEESLSVYIPHPFSYLLLKLYALRDRLDDRGADDGRHHAFDLDIREDERRQLIGSRHCFDALVAALTAREYTSDNTYDPPEDVTEEVLRAEGCIRVPSRAPTGTPG